MTGSIKKGGEQTFSAVRGKSRKLFLFHKGGHQRYNKQRDGIFQYHRIVMLDSGPIARWREYLNRILSLVQAQARIMGHNLRGPDGPYQNIHTLIYFLSWIRGQVLDRNVLI